MFKYVLLGRRYIERKGILFKVLMELFLPQVLRFDRNLIDTSFSERIKQRKLERRLIENHDFYMLNTTMRIGCNK